MSLNRSSRGVPQFPRKAQITKNLGKLKELLPRSTSEALPVLEREAILVGMYWELTQSESAPTGGCKEVVFYPVTRKSARL